MKGLGNVKGVIIAAVGAVVAIGVAVSFMTNKEVEQLVDNKEEVVEATSSIEPEESVGETHEATEEEAKNYGDFYHNELNHMKDYFEFLQ